MMDFAENNELDKYRKYIQKRRVPQANESADTAADKKETYEASHAFSEGTIPGPDISLNDHRDDNVRLDKEDAEIGTVDFAQSNYLPRSQYSLGTSLPALRRSDAGLYKKLYSHNSRKAPAYPSPYKGYSSSSVEIEDNKVSTLAVKLIKQALACFAILGIIVLMQSRPDMKDVLAAVKKQVVEINIEPQSILDGIKNVFTQVTSALGISGTEQDK